MAFGRPDGKPSEDDILHDPPICPGRLMAFRIHADAYRSGGSSVNFAIALNLPTTGRVIFVILLFSLFSDI